MKWLWAGALLCTLMFALACDGGEAVIPGAIPPRPDAGPTTAQGTVTFAIDSVQLGESDRDGGAPSNTAWKGYGYNLDRLVTTKDSTDVCTLHSGAPKADQADGTEGIDNAFGSIILPIFETAASLPTPSDTASAGFRAGLYTLQIQIDGLPDASSAVTGLTVRAMRSERAGETVPAFDTTTNWPVLASSLADSNITSALWQTSNAYIAHDGTVVASIPDDTVLLVPIFSDLQLAIHHATITFERTIANQLDNGTIAGVLFTEDLILAAQQFAGEVSPSLCGSAFAGIADQLRQAADMLADGTNHNGAACSAISVGIGFTATQIANPTQVVPDPLPVGDTCAPKPPPACHVSSISGYTPASLKPSKSDSGACTPADLQNFFDGCLGPSATTKTCDAVVAVNGTCTWCLFSASTDTTWGPIVKSNATWDFNVAGCVDLMGSSTCASSIAAAEGCESFACSSCGYVGGGDPLEREQCIQQADVGDCASLVNTECDLDAAGASVCRVDPTDQASFRAFATVFCGK